MSNTATKAIAIIFLALFVGTALIVLGTFLQGL
jgi:hypothetical protein